MFIAGGYLTLVLSVLLTKVRGDERNCCGCEMVIGWGVIEWRKGQRWGWQLDRVGVGNGVGGGCYGGRAMGQTDG